MLLLRYDYRRANVLDVLEHENRILLCVFKLLEQK